MSGYVDAFERLSNPTVNSLSDHPVFSRTASGRVLAKEPLRFVDVGARGGAHDVVLPLARHIAVLAFEPDPAGYRDLLNDSSHAARWAKFQVEPVALGGRSGVVALHLLAASTNHSLLPPNEPFIRRYDMQKFEKIGEIEVATRVLDEFAFASVSQGMNLGEFIKLDAQGGEYEILEGAERTVRESALAIICEVEFCEIYRGQKLFSDVELFLRERGFSFFGFTHFAARSRKGLDKHNALGRERALWADAVFFKDPLPGGQIPLSSFSERQITMLSVIAVLMGYFDYALELNEIVGSDAERAAMSQLVHDLARQPAGRALDEVRALAAAVDRDQASAAVVLGKLVDAHRTFWDYMDIPPHAIR
jgi:FkbM family methyltransferase